VARHGFLWSWDKNINITEYKIKQWEPIIFMIIMVILLES
jgi:hypothetical protein